MTKRYLDAVLKSQCSPNDNNSTKSDNDEDMESEDIVVSMTPPTSPQLPATLHHNSSRHSNSTAATSSTLREKSVTLSSIALGSGSGSGSGSATTSSPSTPAGSQDAPIDLSMKSTSSGGSSAKANSPNLDRDLGSDEDGAASSEEELSVDKRSSSVDSIDRPRSRNDEKNMLDNATGRLIRGTTPLDLTTKI